MHLAISLVFVPFGPGSIAVAMPLRHLEVENFKSYRGKRIIGPFRSFTSVSEYYWLSLAGR